MKTFIMLLGVLIWTTGCGTSLRAVAPDAKTGYFPTPTKIASENIKTAKPLSLADYKQLAFVRSTEKSDGPLKDVKKFLKESIRNLRFFDRVADQEEMEAYVIQHGMAGQVSNISDLVGLNHLQKVVGNFLVAELTVEWKGGYDFEADLKVIDPANGETVFHVWNKAFNWDGLDEPLFFPMLNALVDWLHQSKGVQQAPAPSAPKTSASWPAVNPACRTFAPPPARTHPA